MKIISPFKDYYDYLQGEFGMDELIVYERIPSDRITLDSSYFHYVICVAGIAYCFYSFKEVIYWGDQSFNIPVNEIEDKIQFKQAIDDIKKSIDVEYSYKKKKLYIIENNKRNKYYFKWKHSKIMHNSETDLNDKEGCPVLLVKDYSSRNPIIIKNPKLADFKFGKVVEPKDIFISIYNFLSKVEDIPDKRTNSEKILTNGFDLKQSFRNTK